MSRLRDAQEAYKMACRQATIASIAPLPTNAAAAAAAEQPSSSTITSHKSGETDGVVGGIVRKMSGQAAKRDRMRRRAAFAAAAAATAGQAGSAGSAGVSALIVDPAIDQYADDEADCELSEAADAYIAGVMSSGRKMRSRSSDAATAAAVELDTPPPRPISPRRISDPICTHSSTTSSDPPMIGVRELASKTEALTCPTSFVGGTKTAASEVLASPSTLSPSLMYRQQLVRGPVGAFRSLSSNTGASSVGDTLLVRHQQTSPFPEQHKPVAGGQQATFPILQYQHPCQLQQQQHTAIVHVSASGISPSTHRIFQTRAAATNVHGASTTSASVGEQFRSIPSIICGSRPLTCRSETASPIVDDDDDGNVDLESVPTLNRKSRPTSVRVRRHFLKSINERSQSSDTIFV